MSVLEKIISPFITFFPPCISQYVMLCVRIWCFSLKCLPSISFSWWGLLSNALIFPSFCFLSDRCDKHLKAINTTSLHFHIQGFSKLMKNKYYLQSVENIYTSLQAMNQIDWWYELCYSKPKIWKYLLSRKSLIYFLSCSR